MLKLILIVHIVKSQSQLNTKNYTLDSTIRTDLLNQDPVVRNYENLTSIGSILDLFSVDVIGSQWTNIHQRLSSACAQNMMEYLSGLERKKIWAIKSKLQSRPSPACRTRK